jgi:methionyl-tRNA formyltransferase
MDGLRDGTIQARPQPADGVSHAAKVTTTDARVDWSAPAVGIDRLIRAVTPEPGSWTDTPWGRMGLGPVQVTKSSGLQPGELAAGKREVLVGTATTAVRLGRLTPPGRREMAAADWARGVRPEPGTVLG